MVKLTRSFSALLRDLANKSVGASRYGSGYVHPSELRGLVGISLAQGHMFAGPSQHDAHELLRFFMSALGEALNRVRVKPKYTEIKEHPGDSDERVANEYWERWWERENSIVSDVFRGQSYSAMRCETCGFTSRSLDPFEELVLQFSRSAQVGVSRSAVSISDLLSAYVQPETLEGEEAWRCPRCATHRTSTKTMSVYRAPKVLVLVLKRFNFSAIRRTKIETPVVTRGQGLQGALHLGEFMTPSLPLEVRERAVYDLIGTVNHMGSTHGGHYTADCLVGREWYNFNDETSHKVEAAGFVAKKEPYVLFYERRG